MKFSTEMASSVGLTVSGKAGTALVHPVHGFDGRRLYVDGGSRANSVAGPLIHLSGFTAEECQMLGAMPNPKDEYSARITGFLPLTAENLAAACKVVREANTPAYSPAKRKVGGVDVAALFVAASKPAEEPEEEPA